MRGCSAMSGEGRFRRMVEGLKREYFFYCHGTDGVFIYVSPSIRNILGYSAKEFLKHFSEYLTDNPVNREVERHTAGSLKGVSQPHYEVEIYHKNGSIRTLEVLEVPVKEKGRVVAVEGIARDITEEKKSKALLAEYSRAAESRSRLILQSSGDGIVGVDLEGRAMFMNAAAEKLLGWKFAELKGKPLHQTIHSKRADGANYPVKQCPMFAAMARGEESRIEGEFLWRKDGTGFPVTYSARPMIKAGKRAGAVINFNDITERKHLEETRDLLMNAIVHDLNNPLAVIIAGIELAAECPSGLPDCDNRGQLRVVGEMARDMRKMVSDILDINRMEEGRFKLDRKPRQPVTLADSAVEAMAFVAKLQSKTVTLSIPAGLPDVSADPGIIKRVLENLIANALRYTPKNSDVSVSAAAAPKERAVTFSVADQGAGINPEHLEKVFEKYFQSDPGTENARKGKGLGLTFCGMAVAAHGGRIRAENLSPKGCRLSFTLPVAPPRCQRRKA